MNNNDLLKQINKLKKENKSLKEKTIAVKEEIDDAITNWKKEMSLYNTAVENLCEDYAKALYGKKISRLDRMKKIKELENMYLKKNLPIKKEEPNLVEEICNGRHYQELNIIDDLFENIEKAKESPASRFYYLQRTYLLNKKKKLYMYIQELRTLRTENRELLAENKQYKEEIDLRKPPKLRAENMKLEEKISILKTKLKETK